MAAVELTVGPESAADNTACPAVSVTSDEKVAEQFWAALEPEASTPFARRIWSEAWVNAHQGMQCQAPVFIMGKSASGSPLFLLPMMESRFGPFRILRSPGWKHSAYQTGLFSSTLRRMGSAEIAKTVWPAIARAAGKADAIVMDGLPEPALAAGNPFGHLTSSVVAEPSCRLRLSKDWDALYKSKTTSKVRSNDRRCERRIAELGETAFKVAANAAERRELIEVLLDQKSAKLSEDGSCDPFSGDSVRKFYMSLADDPGTYVSALVLDGRPVAINLGMLHHGNFHGMVLSMASGAFNRHGPGRILLRWSMEDLARKGVEWFDFGVGADSFKDIWADEAVERRDVILPLSPLGWIYSASHRLFLKAKIGVKSSPALWKFVSRYRKYFAC